VLHERIRYALFVPWLYLRAAENPRRGSDLESTIRRLLIELALRLKVIGGEPKNVIGGEKLHQLTSQPPDRVYWSALRQWRILLPEVDSRAEALRRLKLAGKTPPKDDDGGRLADDPIEVFCNLPPLPPRWDDAKGPLQFKMPRPERVFLRDKLRLLTRPDGKPTLLARLVASEKTFPQAALGLPPELDAHAADDLDTTALRVARDAAALAAIGRAVYGALVEQLIAAENLLPELPVHVRNVLRETRAYVRAGQPGNFAGLRAAYENSEYQRKKSRARLLPTERAKVRRAEWEPDRHNTTPLHYRWQIVYQMLEDLRD